MSLKLHQPGLHRKTRHQAKRKHRAQMLPSTKGKAATRNRAQLTHPGHQEGFRSAKPQPPPKQHGKGLLPQRRQHGAAGQPFHDSCGSGPKFLAAAQQREPQARPVPAQQLHARAMHFKTRAAAWSQAPVVSATSGTKVRPCPRQIEAVSKWAILTVA